MTSRSTGNADLTIKRQVTVYVTGKFTMGGHADTNGNRRSTSRSALTATGDVKVTGNADLYSDIYAPQSDITVRPERPLRAAIARR